MPLYGSIFENYQWNLLKVEQWDFCLQDFGNIDYTNESGTLMSLEHDSGTKMITQLDTSEGMNYVTSESLSAGKGIF